MGGSSFFELVRFLVAMDTERQASLVCLVARHTLKRSFPLGWRHETSSAPEFADNSHSLSLQQTATADATQTSRNAPFLHCHPGGFSSCSGFMNQWRTIQTSVCKVMSLRGRICFCPLKASFRVFSLPKLLDCTVFEKSM